MNLFPVPVYYEHCVFDYSKELEFLKNLPLSDNINDAAYNRMSQLIKKFFFSMRAKKALSRTTQPTKE